MAKGRTPKLPTQPVVDEKITYDQLEGAIIGNKCFTVEEIEEMENIIFDPLDGGGEEYIKDKEDSHDENGEYIDVNQLKIIAEYAGALLVNLEGIFIGGHAAQTRDLLFEALAKYRNGN